MSFCSLSLHLGHKTVNQKFIFQIVNVIPFSINERFSFDLFTFVLFATPFATNSAAPSSLGKQHTTHRYSFSSKEGLTLETSATRSLFPFNFFFPVILFSRCCCDSEGLSSIQGPSYSRQDDCH